MDTGVTLVEPGYYCHTGSHKSAIWPNILFNDLSFGNISGHFCMEIPFFFEEKKEVPLHIQETTKHIAVFYLGIDGTYFCFW